MALAATFRPLGGVVAHSRQSHIVVREGKKPVDVLGEAVLQGFADGPVWHGLQLEIGEHPGWKLVDGLRYDGHFIGMNLGAADVTFETRASSNWVNVKIPPYGFWIIPQGQPFFLRNGPRCRWAIGLSRLFKRQFGISP